MLQAFVLPDKLKARAQVLLRTTEFRLDHIRQGDALGGGATRRRSKLRFQSTLGPRCAEPTAEDGWEEALQVSSLKPRYGINSPTLRKLLLEACGGDEKKLQFFHRWLSYLGRDLSLGRSFQNTIEVRWMSPEVLEQVKELVLPHVMRRADLSLTVHTKVMPMVALRLRVVPIPPQPGKK